MTTRDELARRFADERSGPLFHDYTLGAFKAGWDVALEQLGRRHIIEAARRKMAFRPALGESETTRLMLAEVVRVLSEPTETP